MLERWYQRLLRACAGVGYSYDDRDVLVVDLHVAHLPREQRRFVALLCREALELFAVLAVADPRAWAAALRRRLRASGMPKGAAARRAHHPAPQFLLRFGARRLDPHAEVYGDFCADFFRAPLAPGERELPTSADFDRCKREMWNALTPEMHARLRRHARVPVSLLFRPPKLLSAQRTHTFLCNVRALLLAIEGKAFHAQHQVAAQEYGIDRVFPDFPFVLKLAEVDLHHSVQLPPDAPALLAELVGLGVRLTQNTYTACVHFNLAPGTAFGKLSVAELAPLLTAVTSTRPLAPGEELLRPLSVDDPKRLCRIEFKSRPSRRSTTYVRKVEAVCSAVSASDEIQEIALSNIVCGYTGATRRKLWEWIAFALFSKDACRRIRHVTLEDWGVNEDDVVAILGIATSVNPAKQLLDVKSLRTIHDGESDELDDFYDDDDDSASETDEDEVDEAPSSNRAPLGDDEGHSDADASRRREGISAAKAANLGAVENGVAQLRFSSNGSDDDSDSESTDGENENGMSFASLRAGTTVQISPTDSDEGHSGTERDEFVLESDRTFRIMRDKASSDRIDIIVPGYGYCAVSREAAFQTYTLPCQPLRPSYNGAIEELDLDFKHTSAEVFIPLVRFVGAKLKRLSLGSAHAIPLSKDDVESFLACCPNLDEISFGDAEEGVLSVFARAYRENRCSISRLLVRNLRSSQETVDFLRLLGDSSTTASRLLTEISTRLEDSDSDTLSAFVSMLGSNKTLQRLILTIPTRLWRRWNPRFLKFDGQLLPTALSLDCRFAFLSAMSHLGYRSGRVKNRRRRRRDLTPEETARVSLEISRTLLDEELVATIFRFAAEWKPRVVLCLPM